MPSASTAKVDKQASSEALDPIKQGIVLVEHKIRNLVKKKGRLDTYREIQKSGKELDSDQKLALLKYDEVCQNLSFAQELSKQLNGITVEWAKQQKKKEKKEAYEREQQEAAKVKEILIIQDVLANMGNEAVREDFLAGKNKAVQLTEVELQYLDELFVEITPKREVEENQPPFLDQAINAAKHLLSIVEGKDKEVVGTKYPVLKELIDKINNCGYFDHSTEPAPQLEEAVEPIPEPQIAEPEPEPIQPEPIPSTTFQPSVGVVSQEQPVVAPINETAGLYISQRPMADVLTNVMGAGPAGFNFIQESELESPDVGVAPVIPTALPIPTQTFTNANFSPAPVPAQVPAPVSVSAQPEVLYAQQVPQQQFEPSTTYQNTTPQSGAGDWNDTAEPQNNDWAMQVEQSEQGQSQPRGWSDQQQTQGDSNEWADSNDGFQTARGGNRGGRGRGGGGERGRGGPRGRGNYQNGRGNYQNGRGGGGGYYRNNDGGRNNEGGNNYYQNGYQPRGDREGYQPRGDREGYQPRGDREGYQNRGDRDGYQPRGDREGGPRRGGPRGGGSDRGGPRPDRGAPRGGGGRGGPRGGNRGGNRQ